MKDSLHANAMYEYPSRIVVEGAGTECVNGEYCKASYLDHSGYPYYTMEGICEGGTAIFLIVRGTLPAWTCPSPGPHWVIGRWLGSQQAMLLYLAITNTLDQLKSDQPPPHRGWYGVYNANPPILLMDQKSPLDWRLTNTQFGLEHWTIKVTNTGTSQTTSYTVHRFILANSSYYFRRLFASEFAETSSCTTSVRLDSTVAEAFPYFLDYLYAYSGKPSDITPLCSAVCPLFSLGNYFEVHQLMSDLVSFVNGKASTTICGHIIRGSKRLDAEPIKDRLLSQYSDQLARFDDNIIRDFPTIIDASFLREVMELRPLTEITSRIASRLVVGLHKKSPLDVADFLALTNASVLPFIDATAAQSLLEMEAELLKEKLKLIDSKEQTSLQTRCANAMIADELDEMEEEVVRDVVVVGPESRTAEELACCNIM